MKKLTLSLLFLAATMAVGTGLKAQEVTRTLMPGWTWISCPTTDTMNLATAMGTFVPMQNDVITTQGGTAVYMNGQWRGNLSKFYPGYGYHYKSNRTEPVTVTFQTQSSSHGAVTTLEPTDIIATSAVVGGNVTINAGNHIFARGVCWGTEEMPTVDGSHTSGETVAGSQSITIDGLTPSTIYYVRAYMVIDYGLAYGSQQSFTTLSGEHDYVDLGLPSGLLWATCNVGAYTPEDYGEYYAWGETQPKDTYNWSTYQYCNGSYSILTKYCNDSNFGYNGFTDNLTVLLPEDDAATANWGDDWRMPTKEEFQELYNNTTVTWTTQNGVNGRLFTASNGNSLFMPAAGCRGGSDLYYVGSFGYYWSSSLNTDYPNHAWYLYFDFNSGNYATTDDYRYFGHSVRAVRSSGQNNTPTGAIDGKFTINANGDQVYFSQGNLQYQASTDTWKFADNQYDFVGDANSNISSTYSGWIDLFGWGTSGYHDANDPYNVNYLPWSTSTSDVNLDYNDTGYGPSTNMASPNLLGSSANYDWGIYNSISNGGDVDNYWRTLTQSEWDYVFNIRTTASGIRYAKAEVNNINGVILLPDDWSTSTYSLRSTNTYNASFDINRLTASQWNTLEEAGAVFLPAAGERNDTSVYSVGSAGHYWSASYVNSYRSYYVGINDGFLYTTGYGPRYDGQSVRLVCNVQ